MAFRLSRRSGLGFKVNPLPLDSEIYLRSLDQVSHRLSRVRCTGLSGYWGLFSGSIGTMTWIRSLISAEQQVDTGSVHSQIHCSTKILCTPSMAKLTRTPSQQAHQKQRPVAECQLNLSRPFPAPPPPSELMTSI